MRRVTCPPLHAPQYAFRPLATDSKLHCRRISSRCLSLACTVTPSRSFARNPDAPSLHNRLRSTAMQQSDVESSASKATSEDTSGKTESQDGETLQSLSAHLHQRLTAFLEEKTEVSLIRQVQEQTKDALRVAQDALARYKSVKRSGALVTKELAT